MNKLRYYSIMEVLMEIFWLLAAFSFYFDLMVTQKLLLGDIIGLGVAVISFFQLYKHFEGERMREEGKK